MAHQAYFTEPTLSHWRLSVFILPRDSGFTSVLCLENWLQSLFNQSFDFDTVEKAQKIILLKSVVISNRNDISKCQKSPKPPNQSEREMKVLYENMFQLYFSSCA